MKGTTKEPIDKWRAAYIILVLEGIGMLFPWNAFITASHYYSVRFCTTSFHHNFESWFGTTFSISNVFGLTFSLMFQHKIAPKKRILFPLSMLVLVFIFTTLLVFLYDMDANLVFYLTLLSTVFCGFFISSFQGGIFGLSGQLPPIYTQAIMIGQGIAGVIVSLAAILTALARDPNTGDDDACVDYDSPDKASVMYFLIATLTLLICFFGYLILERLPFVMYYVKQHTPTPLPANVAAVNHHSDSSSVIESRSYSGKMEQPVADDEGDQSAEPLIDRSGHSYPIDERPLKLYEIFKCIKIYALSVFGTFALTLLLFPSVTAKMESSGDSNKSRFFGDLFIPFLFLTFNLWDFVGRASASLRTIVAPKHLWIPVTLRYVFIPLFLLCKKSTTGALDYTLFENDAWPIIFTTIFAISNGYFGSQTMMYGPAQLDGQDNQMKAGTFMAFCLTIGICVGSISSFALIPLTG